MGKLRKAFTLMVMSTACWIMTKENARLWGPLRFALTAVVVERVPAIPVSATVKDSP